MWLVFHLIQRLIFANKIQFLAILYNLLFLIKQDLSSLDNQKLHNCQKCQRKFRYMLGLRIHTKYFHSKKKQAKLTSNDSRKNKSTKTVNKTRVQSNSSKPFKCELCYKMLSTKRALKVHIETVHEKLKPHQCCFCVKKFSLKHHLKRHIECVHEKIKKHVCQICD